MKKTNMLLTYCKTSLISQGYIVFKVTVSFFDILKGKPRFKGKKHFVY